MPEILAVNYNDGTLGEHTATSTDGGDLSVVAPGLGGTSHKLSVFLDDNTTMYGQSDLSWSTDDLRYRVYFDPNDLEFSAGTDDFTIVSMYVANPLADSRIFLNVRANIGKVDRIQTLVQDDASVLRAVDQLGPTISSPVVIETWIHRASSAVAADGFITLLVNDVEIGTTSNLDIFDISRPGKVRIGAGMRSTVSGARGTFYLDELVVRDDDTKIGPIPIPLTETEIADGIARQYAWGPFVEDADVGLPLDVTRHTRITIQCVGSWAGGLTVIAEGSLVPTPSADADYFPLTNGAGTAVSFTASGMMLVGENIKWIRLRATAGSGGASVTGRIIAVV